MTRYYLDKTKLLYQLDEDATWLYLSLSADPIWIKDPDNGGDLVQGPYTIEHVCDLGVTWWNPRIYRLVLQWLI